MYQRKHFIYLLTAILALGVYSCKQKTSQTEQITQVTQVKHPDWSSNVSIYEVNVRQFTKEGTFEAIEAHLPRLKKLGTDILWLMPIHPIGEKTEKVSLVAIIQ